MSKWIAEFELEDGDKMPEHMDLEYHGVKLDFHCRPMWIPVSERLPEEDANVLVTIAKGRPEVMYAKYDKLLQKFCIGNYIRRKYVIAWMPLPEPYREVSE